MQFHYFKLHDLDGNNMLDGIELIKAITHVHGGTVEVVFSIALSNFVPFRRRIPATRNGRQRIGGYG